MGFLRQRWAPQSTEALLGCISGVTINNRLLTCNLAVIHTFLGMPLAHSTLSFLWEAMSAFYPGVTKTMTGTCSRSTIGKSGIQSQLSDPHAPLSLSGVRSEHQKEGVLGLIKPSLWAGHLLGTGQKCKLISNSHKLQSPLRMHVTQNSLLRNHNHLGREASLAYFSNKKTKA